MEEFLALYAEYGAIGIIILLFAGQILFLQRTLMKQLHEIEDIVIKLIDRWNRSDEARDRRHEDIMKEIADLTDKVSYLSGKMSSK